MRQLKVKVANSLKSLLARLGKHQETAETAQPAEQDQRPPEEGEIEVGTTCKNKGCDETYYGSDVELTSCRYHPGVPIFHEGYKYWTCCQRRTSDFDEFLKQEGCTTGEHKWIEVGTHTHTPHTHLFHCLGLISLSIFYLFLQTEKKEVSCRYDWHQTGTQVVIAFYAKACVPEQCLFEDQPNLVSSSPVFQQRQRATAHITTVLRGNRCRSQLSGTTRNKGRSETQESRPNSLGHIGAENTQTDC
ncbi:Cysteine and histidine-rich domain-containing protein [Geodia barretti]|uniref:Cysteine and histidine-rich domain-containing protein n=1 Tax=Geodia barretti TaxID=519541 RepID=A0AA35U3M3_GEOBA|nr:Cysteine and histidine-rich domain-containing protein [Geodia barretti]